MELGCDTWRDEEKSIDESTLATGFYDERSIGEKMEEPTSNQQSSSLPGNSAKKKLQRYGLRSGAKSKGEKASAADLSISSSSGSKRERSFSNVSKSIDLSGKDKSAKPPRRLSVPMKSTVCSAVKSVGCRTPISEVRVRSSGSQGKSETPASDVSRSSRTKFNILSSASYWLSQIKLSEAASNHSVSLGFFKLAMEARCESLQRMRDELKSYVRRHNLIEQGEQVKELFESYKLNEIEQLQISETCSQVPEEVTRSSDDEVHSTVSTMGQRKLKPKSLNTDRAQISPASESAKEDSQQNSFSRTTIRGSWNKNATTGKSGSENGDNKPAKRYQKPRRQESNEVKGKIKKQQEAKSAIGKDQVTRCHQEEKLESNKENMDAPQVE